MAIKKLTIIDKCGNVLFEDELMSLPVKENIIIEKSIEFFNDCEPCIIHRTFVAKKLLFEIDEYLNQVIKSGKKRMQWGEMPECMNRWLDLCDINSVIIKDY